MPSSKAMTPLAVEHGHLVHKDSKGRSFNVPFIPTPNMSGPLVPEGIILHDTAGPTLQSATDWLRQAKAKASAHVVVDLDGSVVQMVPFDRVAWHAGASIYDGRSVRGSVNDFTIGIEIVNPGKLDKDGRAWFHKQPPDDPSKWKRGYKGGVHAATKWHGDGWWLHYPEAQVATVIEVCRALVAAYPGIGFISTHWYISPGRKVDTNPLFPLDTVRAEVFAPQSPRVLARSGPIVPAEPDGGEWGEPVVERAPDGEGPDSMPDSAPDTAPAPLPAAAKAGAGAAAAPNKPGALRTVTGSKSLLMILVAAAFKAVAWVTSWLNDLWGLILWAVGALPQIAGEVKTTLTSSEEVAGWFRIDWVTVSLWVTVAVLAVVFWRHLSDKRELEARRAAEAAQPSNG